MSKALRLLAVLAMVATPLVAMPQAQATPTDCATTWNTTTPITGLAGGDQQCLVTLSVTVPTAATITLTNVATDFGTVLPGGTSTLTGAVTGTISQNGGTVHLNEQVCSFPSDTSPAIGTTHFEESHDGGNFFSIANSPGGTAHSCTNESNVGALSGTNTLLPAGGRTYTNTAGSTFSDSYKVVVDPAQPAGTFQQFINYEVWLA